MSYSFEEKDLIDFVDGLFDRYYQLRQRMDRDDAKYEATVASIEALRTPQDIVQELRNIVLNSSPVCPRCNGEGTVMISVGNMSGIGTCPWCGGTGWKRV